MKHQLRENNRMLNWKISTDPFVRISRHRSYKIVNTTRYLGLTLSIGMNPAKANIITTTEAKVLRVANYLRSKSAKVAAVTQMIYLASVFRYYYFPLILTELADL